MGGDLVVGTFRIECAARHMDISAFVPLQDPGSVAASPVSPSSATECLVRTGFLIDALLGSAGSNLSASDMLTYRYESGVNAVIAGLVQAK